MRTNERKHAVGWLPVVPLHLPKRTTVIGMPSAFATAFAGQQLENGNSIVLLGSYETNNISLDAELKLKKLAERLNLWVLTPHCYAHAFRKGPIGIVGTAGTAIQHVGCLLHRRGLGLSHVYSVGSRDFSTKLKGMETIRALCSLNDDPETEVIVLLLKPIHPSQNKRLSEVFCHINKKVVAWVPGSQSKLGHGGVTWCSTLELLTDQAESLVTGRRRTKPDQAVLTSQTHHSMPSRLGQRYIRGLFSGGSCCDETVSILNTRGLKMMSNSAVARRKVDKLKRMTGHTCEDFGATTNSAGRPYYPMIDLSTRTNRILEVVRSTQHSVVLFDVFLGFGSHSNPAQQLVHAVKRSRQIASATGHSSVYVATVIGIESDPQGLQKQIAMLKRTGVIVADTVSQGASIAADLVQP